MNDKGYGYKLSREWFDWCFENPSKARPAHTAVYFWMIELCNRLGWKNEFGIPTFHSMEATGISSKNTYYKSFNDLESWGFIKIIEKAKNQNTPNIISIVGVLKFKSANIPANVPTEKSALDIAMIQHSIQHEDSTSNIDKPKNNKSKNKQQGKQEKKFSLDVVEDLFRNNEKACRAYSELFGIDINEIDTWMKKFRLHLVCSTEDEKSPTDYNKHFRDWTNKELENKNKKKFNGNKHEPRANNQSLSSATQNAKGFNY